MTDEAPRNWKLLLRYGCLKTPYEHFTVCADVQVIEADADIGSQVGPAWMATRVWAPSGDAAIAIICDLARQVGAEVRGRCEAYKSEPHEPPQDMPSAYDLHFVAYKA
jgi:hypothetical protein